MGLNLDFSGVESFIKARMNKRIDMDGCIGPINTFIVEPFVPHAQVTLAQMTFSNVTTVQSNGASAGAGMSTKSS